MNTYIFVVAAVVSIFSVYFVLKLLLKDVIENKVPFEQTQKKFLLGMFMSKIIPLILLIFGIIKMSYKELNELYIPIAIILIAAIMGLFLIEKVKKDNKTEPTKVYINYLITFTRPLMLTLPIMAIAFLYLMTIK
ncbi:MAG TPA: hypothetical protein VK094_09775 [Pseudogracilibacillus sp.]|nr:hypothetical protein [Pseudogracilibacillus sp.]